MMLAADRIAANVLTASPELRDALYRKYLGVSEGWLRSHGAAEAEEAQETLGQVEEMARRLVAMRLANSHDTTTHEEQPA
jgi:fatty acid/phospholipid biosynthesis enzyme